MDSGGIVISVTLFSQDSRYPTPVLTLGVPPSCIPCRIERHSVPMKFQTKTDASGEFRNVLTTYKNAAYVAASLGLLKGERQRRVLERSEGKARERADFVVREFLTGCANPPFALQRIAAVPLKDRTASGRRIQPEKHVL